MLTQKEDSDSYWEYLVPVVAGTIWRLSCVFFSFVSFLLGFDWNGSGFRLWGSEIDTCGITVSFFHSSMPRLPDHAF